MKNLDMLDCLVYDILFGDDFSKTETSKEKEKVPEKSFPLVQEPFGVTDVHVSFGEYSIPEIVKVTHTDHSTSIIWKDGKVTTVHPGKDETFDRYTGFMAAVCKRLFGSTSYAKRLMAKKDSVEYDKRFVAAEQAMLKEEKEAKELVERRERKAYRNRVKRMMKKLSSEDK